MLKSFARCCTGAQRSYVLTCCRYFVWQWKRLFGLTLLYAADATAIPNNAASGPVVAVDVRDEVSINITRLVIIDCFEI